MTYRWNVIATVCIVYTAYKLIEWVWLAGQSLLIRWADRRRGAPLIRPEPLPRSESVRVIRDEPNVELREIANWTSAMVGPYDQEAS